MLFVSKIRELRLIRKPADRMMDEFRRPIAIRGERVEFENFRYKTEDPDLIEWLVNHPYYGIEFTSDKKDDRGIKKPELDRELLADTDDVQPIKKVRPPVPEMIQGSMATSKTVVVPKTEPALTREEVSLLIKDGVNEALKDMKDMFVAMTTPKPKRTFACKECGLEFGSGVQLGAHKKAHEVK